MKQITERHYKALTQKIYDKLMESGEMGMGEMGECRDEADRIVDEWLEENNIILEELKDESKEVKEGVEGFTGGEWKVVKYPAVGYPYCIKSEYTSSHIALIGLPTEGDKWKEESESNAALIEQAPAMYKALKALSKLVTFSDLAFSPENVRAKEILKKANPKK